mgnify:CR=1 FL=1
MTLSPSIFPKALQRFSVIAVALLYSALSIGAMVTPATAMARGATVYYTAELAAPAKEARVISSGVVWHCEGTTCRATKSNSRAANTCKRLAREVGQITNFTAKGEKLASEKLTKCNSK